MTTLGLALNEDDGHFFASRAEKEMTMEGLTAFVDQYAGTQVSHLFLCPNAQRACYRSKVWDAIWEVGDQKVLATDAVGKEPEKWVRNVQLLDERGLNPYTIWIGRCREKGISPWLSMRMNDIHDVHEPTSFLHSTFRVKHPEYWRVPESDWDWISRAFDYGHPEVRKHHMKLIRELFEMYDLDGLELDWMRFGYHFKPGWEQEGCDILTEFMREVRRLAKQASARRGHPVKVGARVPANPMAARGLGMDGVRWAKEGLVDMLVVTPFWVTTDFDIPLDLWRELLGPAAKSIILAAGNELHLRPYWSQQHRLNDLESVCGFTAAMLDRGADQIYLFNYMDSGTTVADASEYPRLLREAGRLETVLDKPRRYAITYTDTWPPGVPTPQLLPKDMNPKKEPVQFRLYTGQPPVCGTAVIRAGLAEKPGVREAGLSARLNSAECETLCDGDNPELFANAVRMVRFTVPLSAVKRGYNLIELFQREGQPQQIVWVEIRMDPNGET
jgi:hypothetical protein